MNYDAKTRSFGYFEKGPELLLPCGGSRQARREITEEAEQEKKILVEKPVKIAVEEFADGEYKLVESEDIGKAEM